MSDVCVYRGVAKIVGSGNKRLNNDGLHYCCCFSLFNDACVCWGV